MCDVVEEAYSTHDSVKKFTKFYINIIQKEMKTVHGRYYPEKKLIEVFNMSRPDSHIVITTLHEVAHHIDYCLRGTSDHQLEFYTVFKHLLMAAMGMGIIKKEDLDTSKDNQDKVRLIKHFGEIEEWEITQVNYKPKEHVIRVKNSYHIREQLSSRGYKYSKEYQAWEIVRNNIEEEMEFLLNLTSKNDIEIYESKMLSFDTFYYICASDCYSYKDQLKKEGYIWKGYGLKRKSWNKKVSSKDLERELKKVNNFSGINIKVVSK
ncbi:hypothetical protein [Cytobacillus kochii]|uniref:hypothetical protein n=1 Tax=Cytobacillus kochii TaxID=859143 RepID=UPI0024815B83|nr:hypothetical protein [Cytobacillus kochii]